MEPCRDIARGQPVCLLSADRASSCLDGLPSLADGTSGFHACEYHRSMYQGSLVNRACAVQGCLNSATKRKEGVLLCRLHNAKEEKPLGSKTTPQATTRRQPRAGNGSEAVPSTLKAASPLAVDSQAAPSSRAEPADLAELMVELLQGKDSESAFRSLASSRENGMSPNSVQILAEWRKNILLDKKKKGGSPPKR